MTKEKKKTWRNFWFCLAILLIATLIAWPSNNWGLDKTKWQFQLGDKKINLDLPLKRGLDIAGGMQVVLQADMSQINEADRLTALDAAREVIINRVDAYGLSEPTVQTAVSNNQYRILVDLPEVTDQDQALALIGQTAELDFRLQQADVLASLQAQYATATDSAQITQFYQEYYNSFVPTELTGDKLERAAVQFNQNTGLPTIGLEFNSAGQEIFGQITANNVGQVLGIFLDGQLLTAPTIKVPIADGRAEISGSFSVEEAKDIAIQLNAGALPVPITVLEQKIVGATLGDESVATSLRAGLIGLGIVCLFMLLVYGWRGIFSWINLIYYTVIMLAIYKLFGVTLTLAGIAGLLLSIGMAVDSNILIFERMKDEVKAGATTRLQAMQAAFIRAWDSIRDANVITLTIALVLANPLDFAFLNTAGTVRGFGITLLIGTLVSLFTGVFVTQTMMKTIVRDKTLVNKSNKNDKIKSL